MDLGDDNNGRDHSGDDSEEEFLYPGANESSSHGAEAPTMTAALPASHPSPAQLEALYAAASSGDISLLKRLFKSSLESGDVEAFALANDASSRTGLTALHASASRGYIDIVQWCTRFFTYSEIHVSLCCVYICSVIEHCGAIPGLEDKEGEVSQLAVDTIYFFQFFETDSFA
jgi:hypothetical protein